MPAPKKQSGPARIPGNVLSQEAADQLRARGVQIQVAWKPQPAQWRAMVRTETEVFAAASKFSGKTEMGRAWMVQGNPDKPDFDRETGKPIMVNQSYIHHPNFLGAVIRLNEKDLSEWVDRAKPIYEGVLGGTFTKNPTECRWPSGARVFVGHMADSDAWTKYQGQNIVRFLIEEAGQIPEFELFDMIRSCCRSIYPEMRAQIMLTANPGGRGQAWLFDRYIEPKDRNGKPIKHPTLDRPILHTDGGLIPIVEEVENPFTHQMIKTTRIWVPLYLTDNKYAINNTDYIGMLASMHDEKMRKAYLFGDWTAFKGSYFDLFTKDKHTYHPQTRPLASWWKATGSLDWGFVHESAAYKHKQDPETKQHLVYSEFVTSRTDPVELGEALARWWMPELRVQGTVTLYVSHDLFHNKIGEFTWADLISKGVQRVLGKDTCYLPDQLVNQLKEQFRMEGKEWAETLEDRILTKQINGIVLRRAPSARAVGFMHMRSLMRVAPSTKMVMGKPDQNVAMRILDQGTMADYLNYLQSFSTEVEILPQMLISQECTRLIDAIPKAIHDEKNPEDIDQKHFIGADSLDSLRYLFAGIRDEKPSAVPKELERERTMQQALARNPHLTTQQMVYLSLEIEEREREQQGEEVGFCLGRNARASRKQYQMIEGMLQ